MQNPLRLSQQWILASCLSREAATNVNNADGAVYAHRPQVYLLQFHHDKVQKQVRKGNCADAFLVKQLVSVPWLDCHLVNGFARMHWQRMPRKKPNTRSSRHVWIQLCNSSLKMCCNMILLRTVIREFIMTALEMVGRNTADQANGQRRLEQVPSYLGCGSHPK